MTNLLNILFDPSAWENFLPRILDYWRAGGWLLIPIAGTCFLIWYRYLLMRRMLKSSLATPPTFVSELESRLSRARENENLDGWLAAVPGARAGIARHLLSWTRQGLPFREGYRYCRSAELVAYSYSFAVLAALVAAAPLLGLLGTVMGMVGTFDAVAHRSHEATQMVAGGISQALITTQAGLVTALPGALGLAHLARLFKRLKNDLDGYEGQLLRVIEKNGSRRTTKRLIHELAE
jgi:biopolymer transport protein ExbB